MRNRVVLTSLLAALVLAGVVAPLAEASHYRADRPGYKLSIHADLHRVVEIGLHIRRHCSYGNDVRQGGSLIINHPRINKKLDGRGRFKYRVEAHGDDFNFVFEIRGRVTSEAIVGSFYTKDDSTPPTYRCWSGASLSDPLVMFKAPRVSPAPHHGLG